MTITPYVRLPRPRHEVAAVGPDLRAYYPDGTTRHIHNPRAGCRYYMRTEHGRELNRDHHLGMLRLYEGRPYELRYRGLVIYLVRDLPRSPAEAAIALGAWAGWVESFGAELSGIRSTSCSLLSALLDRKVPTSAGDVPPLTEVIGGRIQGFTPPGYYGAVMGIDLQAAYARTLGMMPWGGWWQSTAPGLYPEGYEQPTFHEATVTVSDRHGPYGPLPYRGTPAEVAGRTRIGRWWSHQDRPYPRGTMRSVWAEAELREAIAQGCDAVIHRTWTMPGERMPFVRWWEAIVAGRQELPTPAARRLAKLTGNVLWGSFLSGRGARVEVYDDHGELRQREVPIRGKLWRRYDPPLAEMVTATVRAKVARDLIRPDLIRTHRRVLSLHTDGAILEGHRRPAGLRSLGWRVKYRASELCYLGPTSYAYREAERGPWHYVLAGIPESEVPHVFWPMARELIETGKGR